MENVQGMRGLQKRLKAIGRTADELLDDWPKRAEEIAKKSHRPHKKTGGTERTIKGVRYRDEAVLGGGRGTLFLEYGTEAHEIRPRRARVLAWPANVAGPTLSGGPVIGRTLSGRVTARSKKKYGSYAFAFARRVQHPGTDPDPFMVPAGRKALEEFMDQRPVERLWNKAD